MLFLGQASNYSLGRALRHLLAHGSPKDIENLRQALAKKYGDPEQLDRIALYQTGRSALASALIATIPKHSKVIIPGLTCIAVVRAVRASGCEPVFCDIDPGTLQYDFASLEKTLKKDPSISAIIVQNTLGNTIDIKKVEKLAKQYHLQIVEDLAHSAGRFYSDGRETGTVGAATVLSFGKGKAIDTISGGALILRKTTAKTPRQPAFLPRRAVRWRARWYPVLGCMMRAGYHIGIGKLLTGVFRKLKWIEPSADAELNLDLKLCAWQAKLAVKQLTSLPRTPLREYVLVEKREELLQELKKKGYYFDEIWYDTPVSPVRYKKEADFPVKTCPKTVKVAAEIINLPTWYSQEALNPARELIRRYSLEEKNG